MEIWGWKERKGVEAIQEWAIRWILGIDRRTPGYIVGEETDRENLWLRAVKRVWKFKEKIVEGRGSEIARKCVEEIRKRVKKGGELLG